jgi:diaminopimelate decarboxylase
MSDVTSLLAKYFPLSGSELRLGRGLSVSAVASQHETPLFLYDRTVLDRKLSQLRAALPANFSISYSVKANPSGAILRYFLENGCGLEIASSGEYVQARHACCPPQRIVFAGPGKTPAELEYVLTHGIGEIHAESELELERIGGICRRLGKRADIALRVNPTEDAQGGAMRMGGKPAPFGIDEERLDSAVDKTLADSNLNLCGIHLFIGTQILSSDILVTQYRKGLDIARTIAHRIGHPLRTLDFGGGLGVPYFSHETELDMAAVCEGLQRLMAEIRLDDSLAGLQMMVEPGRYLVAEAGVYITRVSDIKISRGKKYLIVDGGMNHHLAASGNLGQTIKRNYPLALLTKLREALCEEVDVVGPLCTPLDVLGRCVKLPRAEVGDLVGVFQSGAYARAASPLGFLSHPAPPEIWVDRVSHNVVRRRGEFEDYLADQTDSEGPKSADLAPIITQ